MSREIGDLSGRAHCCPLCDSEDPAWTVERQGDVATSWACETHLSRVLELLQRDHEVTRLVVRSAPKAREWAQMSQALS